METSPSLPGEVGEVFCSGYVSKYGAPWQDVCAGILFGGLAPLNHIPKSTEGMVQGHDSRYASKDKTGTPSKETEVVIWIQTILDDNPLAGWIRVPLLPFSPFGHPRYVALAPAHRYP